MEINQLRYFVKIAETENMTQAAAELQVAQPALSKMVRQMEKELGYTLFDRIGKYIYLNGNGKILLRHAAVILNELEDTRNEIMEANEQRDNEVVLCMMAASKLLPDIIFQFRRLHPGIKLTVIQDETASQRWDLRIMSSRLSKPSAGSRSLLKENLLLAVPAQHPLASREFVNLEELRADSFIALKKGRTLREITDDYCWMAGFVPDVIIESDNPNIIRDLLTLEVGVCIIPETTWPVLADKNIRLVRIVNPNCKRYLYIEKPERTYLPKAVEVFESFLVDYFFALQNKKH